MQSTLHSKANAYNVGTAFIRLYNQMQVEKTTKHLPIDSIGHSHNSVFIENMARKALLLRVLLRQYS